MITKIKINGKVHEIDHKRGLAREHQVEEIKNFLCRPKLFAAQHNA